MKRVLSFLLIALPVYLFISLYCLDKHYFLCPIEYKRDMLIRSDCRGDGFFAAQRNGSRMHEGLDLFAKIGTPVFASCQGRVVAAKRNRGMGNFIIIEHAGSIRTIYGHLYKIYVSCNQFVRQGQIIGSVGKSGNANSKDIQPHLHFEIRKNGLPFDPLGYLE